MTPGDAVIVILIVGAILAIASPLASLPLLGALRPRAQPRYAPVPEATCRTSPLHCARAADMLEKFAVAYQSTFPPGAGCADAVHRMQTYRAGALGSMYELRMRLPNDVSMHDGLTRHIQRVERSTLVHVDDACLRCNLGRMHTRPIDDHYYARWYRASNDPEV